MNIKIVVDNDILTVNGLCAVYVQRERDICPGGGVTYYLDTHKELRLLPRSVIDNVRRLLKDDRFDTSSRVEPARNALLRIAGGLQAAATFPSEGNTTEGTQEQNDLTK